MKRLTSLILVLASLIPCLNASALKRASVYDAYRPFERFASYKLDESTDDWSAHGLMAAKLLRAVEHGDAKGFLDRGVAIVYPSVRGNRALAVVQPVLNVALVRSNAIKADGLSITTGGTRYDFVAPVKKGKIGSYACEQFELPLDEQGLTMLRSIAQDGLTLRIYGDGRTHRTDILPDADGKSARERVEAGCMPAVRELLNIWDDDGLGDYDLWTLNQGYYAGDETESAVTPLTAAPEDPSHPALEGATHLLDTAQASAIRAYQALLYDAGFYAYKPDGKYAAKTRGATREAQQYYGLLATGQADRTLIERLLGASAPAEVADASPDIKRPDGPLEAGAWYALGDGLALRLDRWYSARALRPAEADGTLTSILPADRSNLLLIAGGTIANRSANSLSIAQSVWATLTIDGNHYPCQAVIETDANRSFGQTLLPMQESPLLFAAEVPEAAIEHAQAFTLSISSASSDAFTYAWTQA